MALLQNYYIERKEFVQAGFTYYYQKQPEPFWEKTSQDKYK